MKLRRLGSRSRSVSLACHHGSGRPTGPASFCRLVVEIVLQLRATLDDRTRPLLQLALYSFEEWSAHLHMHVLTESNFFGHIA